MNTEGRNEYTYSASGQKLRVVQRWNPNYSTVPVIGSDVNVSSLTNSSTTDYVGNIIYENNALKRILVDGGYYENGNYYFYVNDHLGNNRVVTNAAASVVQSTQYYPFGSSFADAMGGSVQPYKYNGKELDARNGLNMSDYGARWKADWYLPTVDPLAEQGYSWSPYVYCFNNPIKYIDPDGQWPFPSWESIKTVGQIIRDVAVEATEARVTVGLQVSGKVNLSNVKVGAEVNLISTDLAGVSNGEPFYIGGGNSTKADVEFLKQGFEIGVGLIGFSMSDTGIQKGESKQLVNEEKTSLTITPFTIENTKTKPINSNGEQIAPTTEKTEIKTGDIGFSISAIIGLEVKLDLNKAWEVLGRHLNN